MCSFCSRRDISPLLQAAVAHAQSPRIRILTGEDAIRLTGRSGPAARCALNQLAEDGVLAEVTLAKRNRAWESVGLFAIVDELERDLGGGAITAAATAR